MRVVSSEGTNDNTVGTYTWEQRAEAVGQGHERLINCTIWVQVRCVDEQINKISVPDVRHTGSAQRECAVGENNIEEELMLNWGDIASSHDWALNGADPIAPVCILQGVEHIGGKVELVAEIT